MKNPLSTISNISYIIAGWFALTKNPEMSIIVILLGIASTGFHWKRNDAWHKHDIVAIYYVFAMSAGQLIVDNAGLAIGLIVGALCQWWFHFAPSIERKRLSNEIIGILGIICLIAFALQNTTGDTIHMISWFLLSLFIKWIADKRDEFSLHYDKFHAVWHLTSARGIYLLIT